MFTGGIISPVIGGGGGGEPPPPTPALSYKSKFAKTGSNSINVRTEASGDAGDVAIILAAARVASQTSILPAATPSGWSNVSRQQIKCSDVGSDEMAIVAAWRKLTGTEGASAFFTSAAAEVIYHVFFFEDSLRTPSSGGVVASGLDIGGAGPIWKRNPEALTLSLSGSTAPVIAGALFARVNGAADETFEIAAVDAGDQQLSNTSGVLRLVSKFKLYSAAPLTSISLDMGNGGAATVTGGYRGFHLQA